MDPPARSARKRNASSQHARDLEKFRSTLAKLEPEGNRKADDEDDQQSEGERGLDEALEDDDETDRPTLQEYQLELVGSSSVEALPSTDAAQKPSLQNDEMVEDKPEPFVASCDKADKLPFASLCRQLEQAWREKQKTKKRSKHEILSMLLPAQLDDYLSGTSYFPILRLILVDLDTSRQHTGMKENTIAKAWAEAFNFPPSGKDYTRLIKYNDPSYATGKDSRAGDLSMAVYEVLDKRVSNRPSKVNMGEINSLLDELLAIKSRGSNSNPHDWQESQSQAMSGRAGQRGNKKKDTKSSKRKRWVQKLNKMQLSRLEHKWVVRILLGRLDIGFGSKSILQWFKKYAMELYQSHNNLKAVCNTLCDPSFYEARRLEEQASIADQYAYMKQAKAKVAMKQAFFPMLARRTEFRVFFKYLNQVHRDFIKKLDREDPRKEILPLLQPAFIAEVKLDGERMIAHVKRGVVTMQTRNNVWYSDLYSPTLAPHLRRAMSKWDVDVILDSEVVAWDNHKKELIPFGSNRTVAMSRMKHLKEEGMIDGRDMNLHKDDVDDNIMTSGVGFNNSTSVAGHSCWLKFIVFDVVYVDGPGAGDLLKAAFGDHGIEKPKGSICSWTCLDRKKLLYCLIEEQPKYVEFVPSLVVRPNGATVRAERYFSAAEPTEDDGHPSYLVDSIQCALKDKIPDRVRLERELRADCSDSDLSLRRTKALDRFYEDIVVKQAYEGLVCKDLNSQYILDERPYWFKHKPDFEELNDVSDLDLVILGGYYGTGLGPSGLLSAFLLGCRDPDDPDSFMTFCKINGGSIERKELYALLSETGYQKPTEEHSYSSGKWYKETNHGKDIPDFISKTAYQDKSDPWNKTSPYFAKDKYPDLWIHPDDTKVLACKGYEIIETDGFTSGLSLRFPRIEKVRSGADAKEARQVTTREELKLLFQQQDQKRENSGDVEFQSGQGMTADRRFATYEEATKRKVTKRRTGAVQVWRVPEPTRKKSYALQGLAFVVLSGNYKLKESLDVQQAQDEGWWNAAKDVRSRDDVIKFVKAHDGVVKMSVDGSPDYVLGGSPDDPRVVAHYEGLKEARLANMSTKKGQKLSEVARVGGVLKWSHIYSAVHRFVGEVSSKIKQDGESQTILPNTVSIKKTHGHLLKPTRLDYLRSDEGGLMGDDFFGLDLTQDLSLVAFKRALEAVGRYGENGRTKRQKRPCMLSWAEIAMQQEESMRWAVAGPIAKLWPYQEDGTQGSVKIFYPDLFEDFGSRTGEGNLREGDPRCDEVLDEYGSVAASLRLVRPMGGLVVSHLNQSVTHVLCELRGDIDDAVPFVDFMPEVHALNPDRARGLKRRIRAIGRSDDVVFVSPEWVTRVWDD